MDRRYPSHYRSRGNLEPNISEIVNRTRRSMSLISQRYSSGGMDPPPYEQTTYSSTTPADCRNEDVLGNDVHLRVNKSTPPSRPDDNQQLVSNETKQSATDDILSRLSIIEMKLETKNENEDRLKEVESSLLHLKSVVDILTKELKDTRLGLDGLSSQSTNHQSLIEVLQRDIDSRRSTWMKQNEKWRTDIARQIADITADNKTMNEMLVETKRTLSDQVTRADLESLRDRLNISTEQNVTAALGIWHDKVELAVKQLEQRVAAIKVNNIVPNQTMRDSLEDAEVKKYFEALLPSEHLLKGAAFTAVRSMETDIQQKIELQMLASLRSHIRDAREEIRADMTQYLRRLNEHDSQYTQPENGSEIYSFGSDTALAIARYNMGVTEKDRLLKIMFDRIAELSSVVSSIQESLDVKAKTTAIEYQMLERKLNECLNLSAVHMSTIKTRTTELEIHVQDEEKKHHIRHCRFESEVCNKLSEIERVSGVKCEEIATRIASLKEVVDSVVERVNTSKRAFDEHFSASPEIKRLQSNAGKLDGLVMQFTSLRSNVRELESSVSKIQNTTVKSNEMAELKGRICRVEPLIGQVDDLLVAQQKIENNVFNSKDQLLSVTACIDELKAADVKILDRVGKAESTICTSARETRGFNELFERKLMSKIAMVEKTFGEENSSICKNVEDINTILSNTSSNLTSYISSVNQMQEKIEYLARTSSQHRDMMSNVEIRFAQSQQELSRSINSQISALRVQMDRERSEIANLQKIISDINKETQNIETILYQHENNAAHPKAVRSVQSPEIDKGGSSTCIVPEEYNAHDRLDGETSGVSTPVKPSSSSTPVNNAGDTVINLDSSFEDSMEAAPSFPLTTHSTNEDVDRSIAVASPIPSVPSVSEDMKVSVGSSGQQEDNIVSASGHIDGSVDDSTSVHEPEDVRHTSFDVDGSRSSNSDTDSSSSESSSVESTPVRSVQSPEIDKGGSSTCIVPEEYNAHDRLDGETSGVSTPVKPSSSSTPVNNAGDTVINLDSSFEDSMEAAPSFPLTTHSTNEDVDRSIAVASPIPSVPSVSEDMKVSVGSSGQQEDNIVSASGHIDGSVDDSTSVHEPEDVRHTSFDVDGSRSSNSDTDSSSSESSSVESTPVRSVQSPEIDKGGSSTCIVPEEYNAHDRLDGETSGVSTPVKPSSSSTPVNNAGDTVINLDSSFEDSMEAAPSFPLTTHSTNEDVDRSIAVASPIPSVPSVSEDMKVSVGSSGQQEDNIVSASGHIDGSVDDSTSVHEPEDVRHTSFDVDGSRSSNSDTDSSSSESSSVESTPVRSVQSPEIDKGGSSTCIVPEEYNAHDRLDGETSGVSTPVKPSSSSTPVNNAGDTVINLDSSFEDSMEAAPSFPLTTHSTNEDVDRSIAVASPIPSVPSVSEDMKVSVGSSGQQEDNIVSASGHIDGSVDDSTSVHEPEDVRHTSFDVDGSRSSNSDTDSSSSESSSVESTPVRSVQSPEIDKGGSSTCIVPEEYNAHDRLDGETSGVSTPVKPSSSSTPVNNAGDTVINLDSSFEDSMEAAPSFPLTTHSTNEDVDRSIAVASPIPSVPSVSEDMKVSVGSSGQQEDNIVSSSGHIDGSVDDSTSVHEPEDVRHTSFDVDSSRSSNSDTDSSSSESSSVESTPVTSV